MADKAVPISAAEVSIPGFGIRFNGMRLQTERRNYRLSINSMPALHVRITYTDRASYHTQEALSQRIGPNPAECKRSFSSPILQRMLTRFQVDV